MADEVKIEIEDASTIYYEFSLHWYSGMWDPLYRIQCGTFYVSDIDYVDSEIDRATACYYRDDRSESETDEAWGDTLLLAREECDELKRVHGIE